MAKFDKSVLATYGIQTGTAEVLYNPSYEVGRSQRDDWYLHRSFA